VIDVRKPIVTMRGMKIIKYVYAFIPLPLRSP